MELNLEEHVVFITVDEKNVLLKLLFVKTLTKIAKKILVCIKYYEILRKLIIEIACRSMLFTQETKIILP